MQKLILQNHLEREEEANEDAEKNIKNIIGGRFNALVEST